MPRPPTFRDVSGFLQSGLQVIALALVYSRLGGAWTVFVFWLIGLAWVIWAFHQKPVTAEQRRAWDEVQKQSEVLGPLGAAIVSGTFTALLLAVRSLIPGYIYYQKWRKKAGAPS